MMPVSLALSPWEICIASEVRKCPCPPSCVMPASKEFRVRVDLSKNIRKIVWSGKWRCGIRPLNFRFRSEATSSITSSPVSDHSSVVIQSLPLKCACLVSVMSFAPVSSRKGGGVGKMRVARVADGFEQQLEFEIGQQIERARGAGCGRLGRPAERAVVAEADFDLGVVPLEARPVGRSVHRQNVGFPCDDAVDSAPRIIDIESIPARIPVKSFEAAEEARLLDERAAVFGTEDIAVAALVARIGVVGELARLGHAKHAAGNGA